MVKVTTSIDFFPLGLGLLVICILGLFGNILCAVVLCRTKMRSTYSILTLGLTFCDTLYLVTKLIRYALLSLFVYLNIFDYYTEIFYPIFGPALRAITFTAHTGSTYFTIIVAIDRYISVCWPVEARFLCTRRRAYIGVLGVFLFSCIYNIPRWLEFHTESTSHCSIVDVNQTVSNCSSMTVYKMKKSEFRNDPDYQTYYIFWMYFIVMFLIPFTSLSYFNFAIFRAIKQSSKARRKLTSQQKRDASFALMLFSVVVVFLVCSVDYLVLDILTYIKISYDSFWDSLGNVLLSVNSAVNFIIYCVCGRKFRKEFFQFLYEISNGACCRSAQFDSGSRGASNSVVNSGGLQIIVKNNYHFKTHYGTGGGAVAALLRHSHSLSFRIFRAFVCVTGGTSQSVIRKESCVVANL